jgi:hypothetical protein
LQQHGAIVNLEGKRCGPIEVRPDVWERFGFVDGRQREDSTSFKKRKRHTRQGRGGTRWSWAPQ